MRFVWLLLQAVLVASVAAQAAPPKPFCNQPFLKAMSKSPKKASSFCNKFTKTKKHNVNTYPNFLWSQCKTKTVGQRRLDYALSSVCTKYMKSPKTTSAKTTTASAVKTTSKTSGKSTSTTSTALSKQTSSSPAPATTSVPRTSSMSTPSPSSMSTPSPSSMSVSPSSRAMSTSLSSSTSTSSPSSITSRTSLTPSLTVSTGTIASSSSSTLFDTLSQAPMATLIPVIDTFADPKDIRNMYPQNSSALYYAESTWADNPYLKHLFAELRANFTYPTVLVENNDYLTDLKCGPIDGRSVDNRNDTLELKVQGREAIDIILKYWRPLEEMVIIFMGDDCEQTANHTRSYWLGQVTQVAYNANTDQGLVVFFGDEILQQQGIADARLVWGPTNYLNQTTNERIQPNVTYNNTAVCGSIPTATDVTFTDPCTPDFDAALDDKHGYLYWTAEKRKSSVGTTMYGGVQVNRNLEAQRDRKEVEVPWYQRLFEYAVEQFLKFNPLYQVIAVAVSVLVNGFDGDLARGSYNIDIAPPAIDASPWGRAYRIYKYPPDSWPIPPEEDGKVEGTASLYCVKCGVRGKNQFWGSLDISGGSINNFQLGIEGDLNIGLNLGAEFEGKIKTSALTRAIVPPQGIPILTIPGVITAGPQFEAKISLHAEIYAKGQILAGVNFEIPKYKLMFDIVDPGKSTANGFSDVKFTKYFQAQGEIGAALELGFPFSIGTGMSLPLIGKDIMVKMTNTPAFRAEMNYQIEGTLGTMPKYLSDGGSDEDPKCSGIKWGLRFEDKTELDLFKVKKVELLKWEPPAFVKGCIKFGSENKGNASTIDYESLNATVSQSTSRRLTGTTITDSTGEIYLLAGADGAIYFQKSPDSATKFQNYTGIGAPWASVDDFSGTSDPVAKLALLLDDSNRAMFYFTDTLSKFGVSRLRLLLYDDIPRGAAMTGFAPGDLDGKVDTLQTLFLAGLDENQGSIPLLPVACEIEDARGRKLTRLFVVKDGVEGPKVLKDNPDMVSTVTGGTVGQCAMVELKAGTSY
ncbi:hypothetical protein BDZ85DRAFT_258989 [Elsinoe ampelina]|uniref:Uncharacterized protein n=1 Tax=Elsinoe ampelina TaxID=302913 RepID=A0A6A6GG82_9PEZI|nr:hypothetical protein BDZ85DRAFT_258989 [Elsinoe ampelina]